jgi:hypothetical protein
MPASWQENHTGGFCMYFFLKLSDSVLKSFYQDIQTKGIPHVNASSTGPQLREIVFNSVLKEWQAATFQHPLHDHMWTLRDKSGVDLVESFLDSPALRSQCLVRGLKGQEQFAFNKTLKAVVMLTVSAFEMVEKHIDESRSKVGSLPLSL